MAPGSRSEVEKTVIVEANAEGELETVFEHIDVKHGFFINRLRDLVEFRTVSADPSRKDEFPKMADFLVKILKKFRMHSTVMNMIETQEDDTRTEGDVVPLILTETEIDPSKRTVLFYCHYDVHPINYQECWTDPFDLTMTQDESELHGKGTSAGKGPLLCILNAIGAYQYEKIPIPVNVKMILDPMGTVDEDVFGKFLRRVDTDFFFNVDFVCLTTGRWLGNTRPCVCHGARGLCYFTIEVEGPSKDIHSGSYGGLINEPMSDLVYVLNSLVDKNGVIRVTDIYEDVPPVTREEKKFFKSIHFSVRDYQLEIGAPELQVNEDKASILMRLWRQPSLTIHGIQGAFSGPGTKNIIPGKVTGKFSINLVPNMSPSRVKKKVVDYLAKVWKSRKSTNKIRVQMTVGKLFWHTDPSNMNVIAAKNALTKVYNNEPDLIHEPRRNRIANALKKITGAPVIMIPTGKSNDITDNDTEKIDVVNYINGCKVFAAYMKYLAELFPRVKTPEETKCTCKITGQMEFCRCYMQYTSPPEVETDEGLSQIQSLSQMSRLGLSVDEKPEFKYYYLSMMAMKRMRKLQEVLSCSQLAPIVSSTVLNQDATKEVDEEGMVRHAPRLDLGSFSVSDLHDTSKPRTGGWLPKPTKAMAKLETRSSIQLSPLSMRLPESSTKVIPFAQPTEISMVALQPTVFSFRLAQSLKKDRARSFDASKYQVLRDLKNEAKAEKVAGAKGTIPSKTPLKAASKIKNKQLKSSSKSATDLVVKSHVLTGEPSNITVSSNVGHPNVNRSVNPKDVVSSTSRILYSKRLEKNPTASTESLKSANPSFAIQQSEVQKLIRHSIEVEGNSVSPSMASDFRAPQTGTPGGRIKPYAVVSSLSQIMYDKRMNKEITESLVGLASGLRAESTLNGSTSPDGVASSVGSPGTASRISTPAAGSAALSKLNGSTPPDGVASSVGSPGTASRISTPAAGSAALSAGQDSNPAANPANLSARGANSPILNSEVIGTASTSHAQSVQEDEKSDGTTIPVIK